LDGAFDFAAIARNTPGFVGADLAALCKEAASLAINRIFANVEKHIVEEEGKEKEMEEEVVTPMEVDEEKEVKKEGEVMRPLLKTKRETEEVLTLL